MKKQPIAIIGGMGPEASAYLYSMLIKQSIDMFGAVNNDDFPEILLYSIPVPDFISNNKNRQGALLLLKDKTRELNKVNPLCFAIACNTAHVLMDNLQKTATSPFISVIDEVVSRVDGDKLKKVGLLGTPSTLKSCIYQSALGGVGIESVLPEAKDITLIEKIVRKVIAGTINKSDINSLINISNKLKNNGAEGIILGCTELPLVFPKNYPLPIYNSVEILSIALLKKYYS